MRRTVKQIVVAAAVVMTLGGPAVSQGGVTMSGAVILDVCNRPDVGWVDFCNGYFQAVVDVFDGFGLFCIPAGTTRTTVVTVGVPFLLDTPGLTNMNAAKAVAGALSIAWPCR